MAWQASRSGCAWPSPVRRLATYPARRPFKTDAERVAFLFEQYQRITSLLPAVASPRRRVRSTPRMS